MTSDRAARFARDGDELVITPRLPLAKGLPFVVQVQHYTAHPSEPNPNGCSPRRSSSHRTGRRPRASRTAPTCSCRPTTTRATRPSFTIRFDVPAGEFAIANGVLLSKRTSGGRTHYVYLQRQPMATELAQLAVGRFAPIDRGVHEAILVRDAIAPRLSDLLADKLPTELDHLDWMQARVGDYPFDAYGSLVVARRSASPWRPRRCRSTSSPSRPSTASSRRTSGSPISRSSCRSSTRSATAIARPTGRSAPR